MLTIYINIVKLRRTFSCPDLIFISFTMLWLMQGLYLAWINGIIIMGLWSTHSYGWILNKQFVPSVYEFNFLLRMQCESTQKQVMIFGATETIKYNQKLTWIITREAVLLSIIFKKWILLFELACSLSLNKSCLLSVPCPRCVSNPECYLNQPRTKIAIYRYEFNAVCHRPSKIRHFSNTSLACIHTAMLTFIHAYFVR